MMGFDLFQALDLLPGIILGLTVHEAAHAWMADRCGDPTARSQGRTSLDPFRHIDVLGLIILFVAGFGWAKPVEFRPENLRNPQRDPKWIAVAGPVANILTALVLTGFYAAARHAIPWSATSFDAALMRMLLLAIMTNWGLAVFNLIPLPPLDGSHILFPQWKKTPERALWWSRWGTGLLFAAILIQNSTHWTILPIGPVTQFLTKSTLGLLGITWNR